MCMSGNFLRINSEKWNCWTRRVMLILKDSFIHSAFFLAVKVHAQEQHSYNSSTLSFLPLLSCFGWIFPIFAYSAQSPSPHLPQEAFTSHPLDATPNFFSPIALALWSNTYMIWHTGWYLLMYMYVYLAGLKHRKGNLHSSGIQHVIDAECTDGDSEEQALGGWCLWGHTWALLCSQLLHHDL